MAFLKWDDVDLRSFSFTSLFILMDELFRIGLRPNNLRNI